MSKPILKIEEDGTQVWLLNDVPHREDGPALITTSGSVYWFQNGELHREDGPAVMEEDGKQEWYQNGQLHREDGPSVIYSYGWKVWYLKGVRYPFKKWLKEIDPDESTKNKFLSRWCTPGG